MSQAITYSSQIALSLASFAKVFLYTDGFMSNEFSLESFHQLHGNLFHDYHNAIFKILPVINFKWTQQLLKEYVSSDFIKLQTLSHVKERKSIVQQLSSNLDGEVNSNVSLCLKLKGAPLLFGSSTFHLVHIASLKFVSLNDSNVEDVYFELVEFPDDGCILKFTPCLQFQKMRTNVVHNGDAVVLSSTKAVCNRLPNLCTNYPGLFFGSRVERDIDFKRELMNSRITASIEEATRWRIIAYYSVHENDKTKKSDDYLYIGDVIAFNLSEKQLYLNALKPYDSFKKILHQLHRFNKQIIREQEIDHEELNEPHPTPINANDSELSEEGLSQNGRTYKKHKVQAARPIQLRKKFSLEMKKKTRIFSDIDDIQNLKQMIIEDNIIAFQDVLGGQPTSRVMKTIPNSCYWKLESQFFEEGGKVSWSKEYRIRHFQTGRYLNVYQKNEGEVEAKLENDANKNGLFQFTPIQNAEQKEEQHLWKDSFFYLWHVETKLFFGISEDEEQSDIQVKNDGDQITLAAQKLGLHLKKVNLKPVQGHFNTYRMKRIDPGEAWGTSLLLYSLPLLLETIEFTNQIVNNQIMDYIIKQNLKDAQKEFDQKGEDEYKPDWIQAKLQYYMLYNKLSVMLDKYQQFANNRLTSHITNSQEFGMIVPTRQKSIKTEYVYGLICWLLFRSFPGKEIMMKYEDTDYQSLVSDLIDEKEFMIRVQSYLQNETLAQHKRMIKRLDMHHDKRKIILTFKMYLTIKEICKQNIENQEIMMNLLNIFEQHIGYGVEITDTLISTFSDNLEILQRMPFIEVQIQRYTLEECIFKCVEKNKLQVNQSLLDKEFNIVNNSVNFIVSLVYRLLEFAPYTRPDIVKFLASICSFKDEALYVNQSIILRSFIESRILSKHALMTITFHDGKDLSLVYFDEYNEVHNKKFIEFFQEEESNNSAYMRRCQEYLKNELKLYGNLCLNRNMEAYKTFSPLFNLTVLLKYVKSEKLAIDVRAVLLKLIRTLYVDKEPYQIVQMPELVVMMEYNSNILDKKPPKKEKGLIAFIKQLFTKTKQPEILIQPVKTEEKQLLNELQSKSHMLNELQSKSHLLNDARFQDKTILQSEIIRTPQKNDQFQTPEYSSLKLIGKTPLLEISHEHIVEPEPKDLRSFLSGFKDELIIYVKEKYDLLQMNSPAFNVYNELTYEVLKVLHVMLKYGILNKKVVKPKRFPTPQSRSLNKFFEANYQVRLKAFQEQMRNSETERLVNYLSLFLEYDQNYFQALTIVNLQRRYQEQKRLRDEEQANSKKGLSQMMKFTQLTKFSMNLFSPDDEEPKKEREQHRVVNLGSFEPVNDALFQKIQSIKKVLQKCSNKTFTFQEDSSDYERDIKIEICKIFSYLLDIRQDQLIDNVIAYFKGSFVEQVINSEIHPSEINFGQEFIELLPETQLEVGQQFLEQGDFQKWSQNGMIVRNLDAVLERPFNEVLVLALYFANDPELQAHVVDLIQRYSSQKSELISNLEKLMLITDPNMMVFHKDWSNFIVELRRGVRHCQKWLQLDTPANQNYHNEESMMKNMTLLSNILKQFQKNDNIPLLMKQQFFHNMCGFEYVCQLIHHSLSLIDNYRKVFKLEPTEDDALHYQQQLAKKTLSILEILLQVLKWFCKNNLQYQIMVHNSIVAKLTYYRKNNFGQVQFIIDLFCEYPKLVEKVTYKHELKYFIRLIKIHGMFSTFLDFYYIILSNLGQAALEENPELPKNILKMLVVSKSISKVNPFDVYVDQTQEFFDLEKAIFYKYKPNLNDYKDKYLMVIAKCMSVNIGVNLINRTQQILSMKSLLDYLNQKFPDVDMADQETPPIRFDRLLVKQSIFHIILSLIDKTISGLANLVVQGPLIQKFLDLEARELRKKTSFTFQYQYYIFEKMMPLLLKYFNAFLQDPSSRLFSSKETLKQDKKRIFDFGQTFLEALSQMPTYDIINSPEKMTIVEQVCKSLNLRIPKQLNEGQLEDQHSNHSITHNSFTSDVGLQFDPINSDVQEEKIQKRKKEDNFRERGIQCVLTKLKKRRGKGELKPLEPTKPERMAEIWANFVSLLSENSSVNHEVKKELYTFSNSIWNVSQMFQAEVKGDQKDLLLNSEDILVKLLYFIEHWKQNNAQIKNVVFVLKVMERILKECQDDEEKLFERQVIFNSLNSAKILLKLIWNENEQNQDYINQLLKLYNLLLKGGNKVIQKTIYDYVISNTECEKFFYKLHFMISQYQMITSNHNKQLSKIQMQIINRTLRFIQLLCEGHNHDLQYYLHHQFNSKNSYDLILLTVRLLTQQKIDNLNYEIIIQCFETLTDAIQGPCKINQATISNTKFLEYSVSILGEEEKIFQLRFTGNQELHQAEPKMIELLKDKGIQKKFHKGSGVQKILKDAHVDQQKQRGQLNDPDMPYKIALHPGKLARLKFKCLIGIIGLLECNDETDNLILRIVRSIPLKVMMNNLARVFVLFEKYEKGEYEQKVLNRHDTEIDLSKEDDSYEVILEIGFCIYNLMQMFLANKKGKEILYEDIDMRDILDELEIKLEDKSMFEGSIFGELSKLAGTLMKTSLGALSKMKEGFDNALKSDEEKKKEEERKKKEERKQQLLDAIKFFKFNSCSIEVIRNEKIFRIYFPKLPCCHQLPKDLKNEFHDEVDRDTPKTKITYLMQQTDSIINTMRHEETLKLFFKYNPILGFIVNNGKLWAQFAFIMTFIINVVICVSYSQYFMDETLVTEEMPEYKETLVRERLFDPRFFFNRENKDTKAVITILGLIELVFSSMIVGTFLIKRAPLKIYHIWTGYFSSYSGVFRQLILTIKNSIKSLIILLQDFDILYNTLYIFAGIVGLSVHAFFFCIHLMDFLKLEQLKTVVKAIWQPRVELGLAMLLLLITEYYFTIIGYVVFYKHYENAFDPEGVKFCTEFWKCYITTFDWTFKFTGSIGARLQDPDTIQLEQLESDEDYDYVSDHLPINFYSRFTFDNLFNIILVMILLNMIQGIIIDTFGSLREELQAKIDDQNQICFICGIDMEKLDKSSDSDKGFDYHIKNEHYMWNYVFYRAYVDFKSKTEYDGNETFIVEQLKNADMSWFPIGKAKCVADEENEDQVKQQMIQNIEKKVCIFYLLISIKKSNLSNNFDQIEKRIEQYREKIQQED